MPLRFLLEIHIEEMNLNNTRNESLVDGCEGHVSGNIPIGETYAYITFLFTQLALSTFGNALVCIAIFRFRHLRTLTNAFIFSLAITDILTPLVRLVYIAVSIMENRWVFGCFWCKMSSVLGVFLCAASILHLCAISVERFVVIRWPLRHHQLITKNRVIVAIIGIWVTALLLSLFPYFKFVDMSFNAHLLDCEIDWSHKPYLSVLLLIFFFLLPFFTMTGTYYFIFKEVHKQTRRISVLRGSRPRSESKASRFGRNFTIRQELKAVKTVIVVIGVFFVLWLPFFLATSVRAYAPSAVPPSWQRVVLGLAYLNSSCNWVIYSVMNRQIREAFKKLLFTCNHSSTDTLTFDTNSRKFSNTGGLILSYFRRSSQISTKISQNGLRSPYMVKSESQENRTQLTEAVELNDSSTASTASNGENCSARSSQSESLKLSDLSKRSLNNSEDISMQLDTTKKAPDGEEELANGSAKSGYSTNPERRVEFKDLKEENEDIEGINDILNSPSLSKISDRHCVNPRKSKEYKFEGDDKNSAHTRQQHSQESVRESAKGAIKTLVDSNANEQRNEFNGYVNQSFIDEQSKVTRLEHETHGIDFARGLCCPELEHALSFPSITALSLIENNAEIPKDIEEYDFTFKTSNIEISSGDKPVL
uniref:Biogenic amine-like GPCR n=1 Tax=Tripedalia cystophora TaxID=6141 RepID=A0A481ZLI5_TRICY|nr:biogenic amine-like GPCR [Tripedalia cystophora]